MSDGFWRTSTPSEPSFSGPPLPKKQRATTGVRQRSAAPVQPEAGSFEADDASEHGWGAVDDAWGAAEAAAAAPPAAAASGSLHERVGSIRVPAAAAEAVRRQVQFDSVRGEVQRSYIEHLPGQRQLDAARLEAEKAARLAALAALPQRCRKCGSTDLQQGQPAAVLIVSVLYRYSLDVPRASCRGPGCGGTWAPSPCAAGCFPATPRVCLDVSLCGPGLPARWFDWQLLHMSDGLVFEGRRPAAVNSIAAVVHRLHEANGCSEPMGCEHFKRQLHEAVMVSALAGSSAATGVLGVACLLLLVVACSLLFTHSPLCPPLSQPDRSLAT
jgi:hypothetical protein